MQYFKKMSFFLFIIGLGIFSGFYIYKQYEKEKLKELSSETSTVYLLQYGVYKDIDNMKTAGASIADYFYYKENDGYHIIIGITEKKDLANKIKNAYNIENNIYIKEKKIDNNEFIESLRQYDNLITSSDSDIAITNAEKQILSKYEELVLKNE